MLKIVKDLIDKIGWKDLLYAFSVTSILIYFFLYIGKEVLILIGLEIFIFTTVLYMLYYIELPRRMKHTLIFLYRFPIEFGAISIILGFGIKEIIIFSFMYLLISLQFIEEYRDWNKRLSIVGL